MGWRLYRCDRAARDSVLMCCPFLTRRVYLFLLVVFPVDTFARNVFYYCNSIGAGFDRQCRGRLSEW